MFKIGDVVKAKSSETYAFDGDKAPTGQIIWIQSSGVNRVCIEGCGYLFRPENVELLWVDVDISEFD